MGGGDIALMLGICFFCVFLVEIKIAFFKQHKDLNICA